MRSGNWLASYRDPVDRLPLPSWDLWEERRGILAWTASATWAGLQAASNFTEAFGEHNLAAAYRKAADEIRSGAEAHLWQPELGRFVRIINRREGDWEVDSTLDASLTGLWYFGMFAPDDPRVVATMRAIGNPWFICALWLAEWQIATAKSIEDLKPALEILNWTASHALASGVMAEQVHPYTDAPLSVSPLTLSHATLVLAVREYLIKLADLQGRSLSSPQPGNLSI